MVCQMPYGVSSHSVVRVGDKIVVVGGNKNFNIPTKDCFFYDIPSQRTGHMRPLTHVSASHTTVAWKDQYIFKIGGIGNCFEEWGLSPYIERFSWRHDKWEVINPNLLIDESLLCHYR